MARSGGQVPSTGTASDRRERSLGTEEDTQKAVVTSAQGANSRVACHYFRVVRSEIMNDLGSPLTEVGFDSSSNTWYLDGFKVKEK